MVSFNYPVGVNERVHKGREHFSRNSPIALLLGACARLDWINNEEKYFDLDVT